MLKKSYTISVVSTLALAACGTSLGQAALPPGVNAGIISVLSAIMASQVAFPFYQLPNLVAQTLFREQSAVALSLLDAVAFFTTAQVLGMNRWVLEAAGWTASWSFLAGVVGAGGPSSRPINVPASSRVTERSCACICV